MFLKSEHQSVRLLKCFVDDIDTINSPWRHALRHGRDLFVHEKKKS